MTVLRSAAFWITIFTTAPGTLLQSQTGTPPKACSLHMQVTDEDGGEISRAFVLIHSDRAIKVNRPLIIDRKGSVKTALLPGLYDLFVSSPGFIPVAQVVDLRSCKPLEINLMLTLDSEHMETNNQ